MIGGKPATIIGDKHSNLILQGSSVKIQWGNKFIDVIKNGKIASEEVKFIYQISSEDEIKQDGIYILNDELWVVIGDKHIKLGSESYISYIQEQKLTEDQQYIALKNLGFYYDTLEEAQNAKNGIVYIADTQKLYLVNNGTLTEYSTTVYDSGPENDNILLQNLYINENSLMVDNNIYLTCINEQIISERNVYLKKNLYSYPYSKSQGFAIYTENNQSYLEIDHVNERYSEGNKFEKVAFAEYNIIESSSYTQDDDGKITVTCVLKEPTQWSSILLYTKNLAVIEEEINTKKLGIRLRFPENEDTTVILNNGLTIDIPKKEQSVTTSIDYNLNLSVKNSFSYKLYKFDITSNNNIITFTIPDQEIYNDILFNKYIYNSEQPYIYIDNSTLSLYEKNGDQTRTIIGEINKVPETLSEEETPENHVSSKIVGIYSDNFTGLNSKLYSPVFMRRFKDGDNINYPKYDKDLKIPETKLNDDNYNNVVPNIEWVKELINNIIPKGTIVMWSGNKIPAGWVICDGNGGTPDLVNKFVLGSTENNVGSSGDEYKYISSDSVSTIKNGDHSHTVNGITTTEKGSHSHMINFDTNSIPYYKLIYIMKNV